MTTTLVAHVDSTRVHAITTPTTGTVRIVPGSLSIVAGLGWHDPGAVLEFEALDNGRRHHAAVTEVTGIDGYLVAPHHAEPSPLGPLDFAVPGGRVTIVDPATLPVGAVTLALFALSNAPDIAGVWGWARSTILGLAADVDVDALPVRSVDVKPAAWLDVVAQHHDDGNLRPWAALVYEINAALTTREAFEWVHPLLVAAQAA